MRHRISAGAIVSRGDALLFVRHYKPGAHDFWVWPGGGVVGTETLEKAAQREVKEETGLDVDVEALAYIDEFHQPDIRHVKFWFLTRLASGTLDFAGPEAQREHIVDAQFLAHGDLAGKIVFPEVATSRFWSDRAKGFSRPVRLGPRAMELW